MKNDIYLYILNFMEMKNLFIYIKFYGNVKKFFRKFY